MVMSGWLRPRTPRPRLDCEAGQGRRETLRQHWPFRLILALATDVRIAAWHGLKATPGNIPANVFADLLIGGLLRMTVVGLDSSIDRPTAAQADAARAAGVSLWSGYISIRPPGPASQGGSNLLAGWSLADFDNARRCGGTPIAFCSGWDDPAAIRDVAAAWGVRPCLDVEDGIRGDGPWVDDWLRISGAGLYGRANVHHHAAAFHVVARYPASGCAGESWDPVAGSRPPAPCGWQCQGTHIEFGAAVDRGVYDDWFGPAPAPPFREVSMRMLVTGSQQHALGVDSNGNVQHWWNDVVHGVSWQPNHPGIGGLVPYAPLAADVFPAPGDPNKSQLHVWVANQTGHLIHGYQNVGDQTWFVETL